jgi:hypothetical protein
MLASSQDPYENEVAARAINDLPPGAPILRMTIERTDDEIGIAVEVEANTSIQDALTFEAVRGLLLYAIQESSKAHERKHWERVILEAEARGFSAALNTEQAFFGGK